MMLHGFQQNDKLVTAVKEYVQPRNVQELQGFLRLASYYRQFMPQFTKITLQLTGKGTEFVWSQECGAAFQQLKNSLVTTPV